MVMSAVTQMRDKSAASKKWRDYYNGHFPSPFAKQTTAQNPHRAMIEGIKDNQCRGVVQVTVDRLSVSGFSANDAKSALAQAQAARAFDIWQANGMGLELNRLVTSLEVTGLESVIIVYPDGSGNTRLWCQEPESVAFERIGERSNGLKWLAKKYWDGERSNLIVYTQETVEHLVSKTTLKDPEARSYERKSIQDHPFGFVPAVVIGEEGISDVELASPLNDLLNAALCNAAIASHTLSLPMRVISGLELEVDPDTGKLVPPFSLGAERTLFLPPALPGEQNVSFNQVDGANPAPMLQEADAHRKAIANVTRTPLHLLQQGSAFPSGAALQTAEASFVAKVRGKQRLFGSSLDVVLSMALVVDTYMATGLITPGPGFTTLWVSPESSSMESDAKTVQTLVAAGIPLSIVLQEVLGWDIEKASAAAGAVDTPDTPEDE